MTDILKSKANMWFCLEQANHIKKKEYEFDKTAFWVKISVVMVSSLNSLKGMAQSTFPTNFIHKKETVLP